MNQNNSARCLHKILKNALETGSDEKPIHYALAPALKIDHPDLERYKYADFLILIRDVENTVRSLKKIPDLDEYILSIQELSNLLFGVGIFQGPWGSVSGALRQGRLLMALNSCAVFIDQEHSYPDLSDEQLQQYLGECEKLIKKITESDLEESIKSFLIIRLEEICVAIRQYHLGGTERLKKVVEENIGGMLLRLAGLSAEDPGKAICMEAFTWCLTFGGVLDLAANVQGYLLPKVAGVLQYFQNSLPPGN